MSTRESKALRSVVADLAQLRDEDVQAILLDLDAPSRNRLSDLLGAYRRGAAGGRAPTPAPCAMVVGSWLSDRLSDRKGQPGGMTAHAVQALKRIAADHGWSGSPVEVRQSAPRSLIDQMGWRP